MPDGSGWEYHIVIEGWEPQVWRSLPGGESELVTNQFDIVVVPDKGVIVVKLGKRLVSELFLIVS